MVTASKGVALDFDSVARDSKASSKEMYVWGQAEAEDVKDVTDRLAYFNFVQGSLASTLSTKLDASRMPLKALRDSEATLSARRNIRAGYDREISKNEMDHSRNGQRKVQELTTLLRKAEVDDEPLEKENEKLTRNAIRESEQAKWDAIREYGEKLVILSQAATKVIQVLPVDPPSAKSRYEGAQTTASIRAAVQHALDNYKPGHLELPLGGGGADLSRSDTRSFGETHASELSSISATPASSTPNLSYIDEKPAPVSFPEPSTGSDKHVAFSPSPSQAPPVINPQQLNQAPAEIPIPVHDTPNTATLASADPTKPGVQIPTVTPTVAETGIPQSAGPEGPGPSSGTLKDVRSPTNPTDGSSGYGAGVGTATGSFHESAEDEKKRLGREERERVLGEAANKPFESAEDEKKRLERQEREKLLASGAPQGSGGNSGDAAPGEDLPPYKEF
jgi:hypothetical protein